MDSQKPKGPEYQRAIDLDKSLERTTLGLISNQTWYDDPRHLMFVMARYKFVAKMLSGKSRVLEIGCGDGFYNRIVLQEVGSLCAIDFEPIFARDVNARMDDRWRFEHRIHDILDGPIDGPFDAAYSIDVIEHITAEDEHRFMSNVTKSLDKEGVLLIGTPSVQSQVYASEDAKRGHVNCKDAKELKELTSQYFHNVFLFSMNDEVVHTGYYAMAHYLFALCVGKKRDQ